MQLSHDVNILNSKFDKIGCRAIFITDGKDIHISGNRIQLTGEGGIDVSGGDRITLTPGNITIEDNQIRRFSEIVMTYRPAIRITGVGNVIRNNHIYDAPHSAIIFEGE